MIAQFRAWFGSLYSEDFAACGNRAVSFDEGVAPQTIQYRSRSPHLTSNVYDPEPTSTTEASPSLTLLTECPS